MLSALSEYGGKVETGGRIGSLDQGGDADLVLLDVAPGAAVQLVGERMPSRIGRALLGYRHGPGVFKVEFALSGDVPWTHEDSRRAGTVHVVGNWAELARAEQAVVSGRMPDRPYVLVGQQYLADLSRASGGLRPLYTYAHVPSGYRGDATLLIETQIERFAPGFRDLIVARAIRTTVQLEAYNPNYVGGDVVTGANTARQLIFRPRVTLKPYELGVPGVYLCSAATPPGAGAHGMCGYNAAHAALASLR